MVLGMGSQAQLDHEEQPGGPWKCVHNDPFNEIELLVFLKAPGRLQVRIDGQTVVDDSSMVAATLYGGALVPSPRGLAGQAGWSRTTG
jgi:hypothetical protein